MRCLTSNDFDTKRALPTEEGVTAICRKCGAQTVQFLACKQCGSEDQDLTCKVCSAPLLNETIEFTALRTAGTALTREIGSHRCEGCRTNTIDKHWTEQFDEVAAAAKGDIRILTEIGILTPKALEVFASADRLRISKLSELLQSVGTIQARFGMQSDLFESALNIITDYDTEDFGHSGSWTFTVKPPPYDRVQRTDIHVALAKIQSQVGSPIHFWSTHFRVNYDEELPVKHLAETILHWTADHDRAALRLTNDIAADVPPGRLMSAFRLLELILHRLLDDDLSKSRHNPAVSDPEFKEMISVYGMDLKSRLRRRVESMAPLPTPVLTDLWKIVRPGRSFSLTECYDAIIQFRNRHAHKPTDNMELSLPWEEPDHEAFINGMLALMTCLLKG